MLFLCRVVLLSLLFQLISSDDTLINETLEDEVDIKQSRVADKVTELNSTNETFDTGSRENVPVGIQSRYAYSARHGNVISPANTLSQVGKSVSLKCRGRSTKVQWWFLPEGSSTSVMIVHGDCKVDARYIDDYDVDITDQACNLVIDSVTMDFAGTYTCDDRSTRSSAASARLIVLESEPSCKSSADRAKFLTAGTEVRFSCSVHYSGALAPVMTWIDEFGQVMSSSTMDNETFVESSLVVKTKPPGLSPYYCRTYFNKFPPVQTSKHITVANNTIDYVYPWTSKSVLVKPDKNLAFNNPALQSSTFYGFSANLAVDGNTDGNFHHGSCTHTSHGLSWWAVDFGNTTYVGLVRITNRGDCCASRLEDFYIGLTNVSPWTTAPMLDKSSICKYYAGFPPEGIPTDIYCEPNIAPGRYLFVQLSKANYLTICELEAYLR